MEENLKKLKNIIKSNITLDDEIVYILKLLNEKQITTDRRVIHSVLYEIGSKVKGLKISELIFDESSIFPYSEELEDALFRLEISDILPYSICYDSQYDLSYLNKRNDFNEVQKNELEKATQFLRKSLIKKR